MQRFGHFPGPDAKRRAIRRRVDDVGLATIGRVFCWDNLLLLGGPSGPPNPRGKVSGGSRPPNLPGVSKPDNFLSFGACDGLLLQPLRESLKPPGEGRFQQFYAKNTFFC